MAIDPIDQKFAFMSTSFSVADASANNYSCFIIEKFFSEFVA